MKCFWCQEREGTTNDHLIPQALAKTNDTVKACPECNGSRGRLVQYYIWQEATWKKLKEWARLSDRARYLLRRRLANHRRKLPEMLRLKAHWVSIERAKVGRALSNFKLWPLKHVESNRIPETSSRGLVSQGRESLFGCQVHRDAISDPLGRRCDSGS